MSFTEEIAISQVVSPMKEIEVCRLTITKKDGVVIAQNKHWNVYVPGDDVSQEDATVQTIATALWTPTVIAEFAAWRAQCAADQEEKLAALPV